MWMPWCNNSQSSLVAQGWKPSKSEIYFTGVDEDTQQEICTNLIMSKGSLPFKYLGSTNNF